MWASITCSKSKNGTDATRIASGQTRRMNGLSSKRCFAAATSVTRARRSAPALADENAASMSLGSSSVSERAPPSSERMNGASPMNSAPSCSGRSRARRFISSATRGFAHCRENASSDTVVPVTPGPRPATGRVPTSIRFVPARPGSE
jgi:hypothetical protein